MTGLWICVSKRNKEIHLINCNDKYMRTSSKEVDKTWVSIFQLLTSELLTWLTTCRSVLRKLFIAKQILIFVVSRRQTAYVSSSVAHHNNWFDGKFDKHIYKQKVDFYLLSNEWISSWKLCSNWWIGFGIFCSILFLI